MNNSNADFPSIEGIVDQSEACCVVQDGLQGMEVQLLSSSKLFTTTRTVNGFLTTAANHVAGTHFGIKNGLFDKSVTYLDETEKYP